MNIKRFSLFILTLVLVGVAIWLAFFRGGGEDEPPATVPAPTMPVHDTTGTGEYVSPGKLIINEVMASNDYTITTEDGSTPDWIELYNGYSETVNLSGWGITDDTGDPYKFTFPSVNLEAGGYMVIYCTPEKEDNPSDGFFRTGFKLSSSGESVVLSAPGNEVIDSVSFGQMVTDISYGRDDVGTYVYFGLPTPGQRNAGPVNSVPEFEGGVVSSPVVINELMPQNDYSVVDADGDRSDWVELKNTGDQPVSLSGYGISDDRSDAKKWVFPDIELAPGEIRLVFLSGKDRKDAAGELHTNFSLGAGDQYLILSQAQGRAIDSVAVEWGMGGNVSKGRSPDGGSWVYFPTPTPGGENTTKYFDSITEATDKYLPDLRISEAKSVGEARDGEPDWIELANKGQETIDLTGYGLSDDPDDPFAYTFGSASIAPGEYMVIEVGDSAESEAARAFGLSSSGDEIWLSMPNGTVLDVMRTGIQRSSVSSGRAEDGSTAERVFFTDPTPGAANSAPYYTAYASEPVFGTVGGYVESGAQVTLTASSGAAIYYTTNGSEPTTGSAVYSGPITVTESTPIRAMASEDGKLNSAVVTENFLVETPHDIPVVCIATDHDGFFGSENGIHSKGPGYVDDADGDGQTDTVHQGANYWKDWEREISFEFFEADGTKGIEFPAGIRIFGQYSREEDQKSFAVYLRGAYGLPEVTYPFFRDYDVTTFSSLLLRTSGQDWNKTKLRDAFFAQAVKGVMDIDYMEYRPVALYINGEYWGLYNLREKQNEDYIYSHHGIERDNLDILKGDKTVQSGSRDQWKELRSWLESKGGDLEDDDDYEYVASRVDIQEFINYIIVETYFNNTDTGNIRCWKPRDGGKWRWMLFDMDWGLSDTWVGGRQTYQWNMIEEFFDPAGHGVGNAFETLLQSSLKTNYGWRKQFIETYAYHINNTFQPKRLHAIVDAMAAEIRSEIPRHTERWGQPSSAEKWEENVAFLKKAIEEKVEITIDDIQEYFGLGDERMHELFPKYR